MKAVNIGLDKLFQRKIVNIFFPILFSIGFGCLKEPSHWDGSFEYPQHMFWFRNQKIIFLTSVSRVKYIGNYLDIAFSTFNHIYHQTCKTSTCVHDTIVIRWHSSVSETWWYRMHNQTQPRCIKMLPGNQNFGPGSLKITSQQVKSQDDIINTCWILNKNPCTKPSVS